MTNQQHRDLTLESIESRIVLSANSSLDVPADQSNQLSADAEPVFAQNDVVVSHGISEQAYIAADNSFDTARDLGVLRDSRLLQEEYVGRFDRRDVFRFELEQRSAVDIDLFGLTTDADLFLYDVEGERIATSEKWGSASESIKMDLAAGEYFLLVSNFNRWTSTLYSLELSVSEATPLDLAGNTFDDALDIGELASQLTYSDFVGTDDDTDIFRFQLSNPARIRLDLTGLQADGDLYLYSADEELLAESTLEANSDELIDTWIADGLFYAVVVPYEAANTDFSLTITKVEDGVPPTQEPPADPDKSDPVEDPPTDNSDSGSDVSPLPDVPDFGGNTDWGLNSVNAPEAWNAGYHGEGVTVAVIDTGFQLDHVDLQNTFWVNSDEIAGDGIDNDDNGYIDDHNGWDFVDGDADPNTIGTDHATHIAGVIAANFNGSGSTGVAYAAQVMPIRVLDDQGSGTTYDVALGIRYAVDNGADIINLSLGGDNSASILSALRYAESNDVFVVVAAGNEGNSVPGYPGRHSTTLTNVLSIGAYSASHRIASFSNRVGDSQAIQVDAPGVSIYNTVPTDRHSYLSGTSMATPYAAGVAALILSANPDLTSSELRDALTQGAINDITGSDSIGGINAAVSIPLGLGSSQTTVGNEGGSAGAASGAAGAASASSTNADSASQRVYATIMPVVESDVVDLETLAAITAEQAWLPTPDDLFDFTDDMESEPLDLDLTQLLY